MSPWYSERQDSSGRVSARADELKIFYNKFFDSEVKPVVDLWGKNLGVLSESQKKQFAQLMRKFFLQGDISFGSDNDYEEILFKEFGEAIGRPLTKDECFDIEEAFMDLYA